MKLNHITLIFLFFFLVLPVAIAQPPFNPPTYYGKLYITPIDFPYLEFNSTHYIYIGVINGTSILNGSQISCSLYYHSPKSAIPFISQFTSYDSKTLYARLNLTNLPLGIYRYNILCNSSQFAGTLTGNFWITESGGIPPIEESDKTGIILSSVLIPFFFGILLLFGLSKLGADFNALKLGGLLLIPFLIIMSIWLLVTNLISFYNFTALQNALTTQAYIYGSIAFIIFSYISLHILFNRFQKIKEDNY